MSNLPSSFTGAAAASPADENALLRAALIEAQARIRALEAQAGQDCATGLPDRARFDQELERAAAKAERHGTPAAVVEIVLETRDGRGLPAESAARVADLLARLVRTSDIVARIGEDSFGLILDHLDHDSALDTAERIARRISADAEAGARALAAATALLPGDKPADVMARLARNLDVAREG